MKIKDQKNIINTNKGNKKHLFIQIRLWHKPWTNKSLGYQNNYQRLILIIREVNEVEVEVVERVVEKEVDNQVRKAQVVEVREVKEAQDLSQNMVE